MADHDAGSKRGRAHEDEYFRQKDRELIERLRQASAVAKARQDMSTRTGLSDPGLLQELQDLGFTTETVVLLPLVPLVQVAWAEGGVTPAERDLIVQVARKRGIAAESGADLLLTEWLTTRPAEAVFTRAGRLIRAMLDAGGAQTADLTAEDLVKYCEAIATASGGVFGIGRMSAEERTLISNVAADLNARRG